MTREQIAKAREQIKDFVEHETMLPGISGFGSQWSSRPEVEFWLDGEREDPTSPILQFAMPDDEEVFEPSDYDHDDSDEAEESEYNRLYDTHGRPGVGKNKLKDLGQKIRSRFHAVIADTAVGRPSGYSDLVLTVTLKA